MRGLKDLKLQPACSTAGLIQFRQGRSFEQPNGAFVRGNYQVAAIGGKLQEVARMRQLQD